MWPNRFNSRRMGGTQAGYGEQRTRAQTLAEHKAALSELRQELRQGPCMHMPNIQSRKSNFGAACPYEQCSNILIKDLEVGATHRRRVLKGRLVTDAIKMQSVQTVLEDDAGDVVTVHIYNVPGLPPHVTIEALLAQAQAMFSEGDRVAVIEPYYKLMLDGTHGVRVDNPNEVVFLSDSGEPDISAAALGTATEGPFWMRERVYTVHGMPGDVRPPLSAQDGPPVSKPRRPNRSKKGKKRGGGSGKSSSGGASQ